MKNKINWPHMSPEMLEEYQKKLLENPTPGNKNRLALVEQEIERRKQNPSA